MNEPEAAPSELDELLKAWASGDEAARVQILARMYPVMRAIAQKELARRHAGLLTVSATTLAHECVVRLMGQDGLGGNEGHFIALAATVIRRVSVDMARRKLADIRGGGVRHLALEHALDEVDPNGLADEELCMLDQALAALESRDSRAANVLELRFFGGLSNEEVASHLGVSLPTVVRDWRFGRAFLARRMGAQGMGA